MCKINFIGTFNYLQVASTFSKKQKIAKRGLLTVVWILQHFQKVKADAQRENKRRDVLDLNRTTLGAQLTVELIKFCSFWE